MAEPIIILVGTMTGTADLVAQEIGDVLETSDLAVEIRQMESLSPEDLAGMTRVLLCTSTYGQGDVPDNARDLVEALETARPDLSALHYGVIALGDRTYAQTYCQGGLRIDRLLAGLGAQRIGDPLCLDASSGEMPEDAAVAWVPGWLDLLRARLDMAA